MTGRQDALFGARLRQLREAAGLTQEDLAARSGLSAKGISDLERGARRRPHPHTVRTLAEALQLTEAERTSLLTTVPKRGQAENVVPSAHFELPLPMPSTPIIGRERDLKEVASLLRQRQVRLLTLTGAGGVGKTRLALEAAREVGESFPDGVAFVSLAPLSSAEFVVPSVARFVQLRETSGQSTREVLRTYLGTKRLLLVLDNFEHLLEAAPDVSWLIEACPNLTVLATSRAPLRVGGEQEYPVPPLELPASTRDPGVDEVLGSPSGRLFVERARAASPQFTLSPQNAGAVASICWRLAGLPLALELAAAKVRFLSPSSLLARLDRALSTGWARDVPERHRTVRATLDWSHELLSEPEKVLFRRLSVFVGNFMLEAAEAVGEARDPAVDDVLEPLGRLVDQSLVTAQLDGDEMRYGMLEPVRQYAREKLEESGEAEETLRRHAEYYLLLAERADRELTKTWRAEWMDRFEQENDNVRAAIEAMIQLREPDCIARFGWVLWRFWSRRGHAAEALSWLEQALDQGELLSPDKRARVFLVIGMLSFIRGEIDRAARMSGESTKFARSADDSECLAHGLVLHGLTALSQSTLESAGDVLAEGLALFRHQDHRWGTALALVGLSHLALAHGRNDEALHLAQESEALSREAKDWSALINSLNVQALAARLADDPRQMSILLRESLELAAMLRDAWSIVYCVTGLAGIAARQGQYVRSVVLFSAAESIGDTMGVGVPWAVWQGLNERDFSTAREELDAETFNAAWAKGQSVHLDDLVDYALHDHG